MRPAASLSQSQAHQFLPKSASALLFAYLTMPIYLPVEKPMVYFEKDGIHARVPSKTPRHLQLNRGHGRGRSLAPQGGVFGFGWGGGGGAGRMHHGLNR